MKIYGWFSELCAKKYGTSWYSKPDGGEVELTQISSTRNSIQNYPDTIFLCELDQYLRPGKPPNLNSLP